MVRVCPERDIVCPHGDDCPYGIDHYRCTPEGLKPRPKGSPNPMFQPKAGRLNVSQRELEEFAKKHRSPARVKPRLIKRIPVAIGTYLLTVVACILIGPYVAWKHSRGGEDG